MASAVIDEIRYEHQIGKWPEMAELANGLPGMLDDLGFDVIAADAGTVDLAGGFDWPHRDPFDRMIAATCIAHGLPLVSKDTTLDTVPGGIRRVW